MESKANDHWIAAVVTCIYALLTLHFFLKELHMIDIFCYHIVEYFEGDRGWASVLAEQSYPYPELTPVNHYSLMRTSYIICGASC